MTDSRLMRLSKRLDELLLKSINLDMEIANIKHSIQIEQERVRDTAREVEQAMEENKD